MNLQHGDSIIAVNGTGVLFKNDIEDIKTANYDKPLSIAFIRNGKIDTAYTTVPRDSAFGIFFGPVDRYFNTVKIKYAPLPAIKRGFTFTISRLQIYVAQFKLLGSKEVKASESMGGFYSMGKMYSPKFSWHDFLTLTAFISVALAFMNLLPIPGLDGGYVIFLLFEMLTGKKVSEKVMERATTVGLVILLALMVYVNGLDVLRIFHIKI